MTEPLDGRFPRRVVSGGQTGVDRAALDAAMALGLPHGGWCPRGRRAEDGPIPARYALEETDSPRYAVRTERNVVGSSGTLVLTRGAPAGGTALTVRLARRHGKPLLAVDLAAEDRGAAQARARSWLVGEAVSVLNVAGPRESTAPGVYAEARGFLEELLAAPR